IPIPLKYPVTVQKQTEQTFKNVTKILDSRHQYPLHTAAREGNIERVISLIQQDFSVNHSDPDLVKPLHEACFHGRFQCVKILLENGAEVNARNIDGATPLCDAASSGHINCVKLLIANGASVNPVLLLSSPLHEAALRDQWECMEILSKAGANLNASDCHYGTALHITANQGFINSAEVLLRAGANVNAVKTHSTPLHEAAIKQDIDSLGLLLEYGADVYARNNKGLHAIDLISSSTNPSKELLLYWMNTVPKLTYLTRQVIRRQLGQAGLMNVDQLMLPKLLKNYIEHR
ncbi:ankyrin repeat and SOCS box protein 13-like, partial [Mytilus californianus]|uniref:ankyrin repeat and SOCS box protein 13-like n=1 Tax=Mytilus californianus TaxID=6549 RepID=UPI0022469AA9